MAIAENVWKKFSPEPFAQAKQKLQSGDILLASGNGVVSNLIRKATDSSFSHVGLILQLETSGQWLVLESVETRGVRCVTLEDGYLTNYCDSGCAYDGRLMVARCDELKNTVAAMTKLYTRAFSLLGDHYNKEEIFEIGTRIVAAKLGVRANGKLQTGTKYICSEYVYACLCAAGVKLAYDKDGFIAPKDIAQAPSVNPVVQLAIGNKLV